MRSSHQLARSLTAVSQSRAIRGAGSTIQAYAAEYRRALAASAAAEQLRHDLSKAAALLRNTYCPHT